MSIARTSPIVLLGTSDSVGITITTGSTSASGEIDLGSDAALLGIILYLKFTSTVAVGSVDVKLTTYGVSGTNYGDQIQTVNSFAPTAATQRLLVSPIGSYLYLDRFINASVFNNATGASITNVFLWATKFLQS